ncbi:hypothetical protein PhaeoP48_01223 [Phaeobacter inhibens]|nr:hypothetical protein PhaeoP48_01223 [Phaeobacter inhibens]
MSGTGKTVAGVAGANAVAQGGTEAVKSTVPFLEAQLIHFTIDGAAYFMTPQHVIIALTGVLSVMTLSVSLFRNLTGAKRA